MNLQYIVRSTVRFASLFKHKAPRNDLTRFKISNYSWMVICPSLIFLMVLFMKLWEPQKVLETVALADARTKHTSLHHRYRFQALTETTLEIGQCVRERFGICCMSFSRGHDIPVLVHNVHRGDVKKWKISAQTYTRVFR